MKQKLGAPRRRHVALSLTAARHFVGSALRIYAENANCFRGTRKTAEGRAENALRWDVMFYLGVVGPVDDRRWFGAVFDYAGQVHRAALVDVHLWAPENRSDWL